MNQEAKRQSGLQFVVQEDRLQARIYLNVILASIAWFVHFVTIILLLIDLLPFNFWSGLFVCYTLFMALGWGFNVSKVN